MFDIAFSELLLVAVVALIVIGPEKLPKVARTLGLLAGRLQRYVATVKADIDRELQFEDLRNIQQEIRQGASQFQSQMSQIQTTITDETHPIKANEALNQQPEPDKKQIPDKDAS